MPTRMVGLEKKTKVMKRVALVLLMALIFSSCVVTTRPIQSPRYFSEEPPRYYYWYSYPHYTPQHHYNYNQHHHHNPSPRPRHYGPRR